MTANLLLNGVILDSEREALAAALSRIVPEDLQGPVLEGDMRTDPLVIAVKGDKLNRDLFDVLARFHLDGLATWHVRYRAYDDHVCAALLGHAPIYGRATSGALAESPHKLTPIERATMKIALARKGAFALRTPRSAHEAAEVLQRRRRPSADAETTLVSRDLLQALADADERVIALNDAIAAALPARSDPVRALARLRAI